MATEDPRSVESRLAEYARLVEGSPHNLLSERGLSELRTRHIPECRSFADLLPRGVQRVCDLGSGGGLPGVVIAIERPDLDIHLVERTRKKAAFLEEVASALELGFSVHPRTAEELARSLGGTMDVVTARAVAPLSRLVGLAFPLLSTNGLLYAIKGERWREELTAARNELSALRLQVVATPDDASGAPVSVPHPRVIVVGRGS